MNSEINIKFEIDTTTLRLLVILAALIALILVGSRSVGAQEVADTIRINTRVVFMDALVKDTRFLVTADRSERRETDPFLSSSLPQFCETSHTTSNRPPLRPSLLKTAADGWRADLQSYKPHVRSP